MKFCSGCGKKLKSDENFCSGCGRAVTYEDRPNTRKQEYVGKLLKCPNCGEVINSFSSHCESCNFELRDISTSNSVKEFSRKMELIESKAMPAFESKKSILKSIIGRDLNNDNARAIHEEEFYSQKKQEKIDLIINFPIPNSKEDLLEFMFLIISNIDFKSMKDDDEKELFKAWCTKFHQVYKKSKLTINNPTDRAEIENMYIETNKKIFRKKYGHIIMAAAIILLVILFLIFNAAMIANPTLTIVVTILIFASAIGGTVYKLFIKNRR